jgi:hypothetical protein
VKFPVGRIAGAGVVANLNRGNRTFCALASTGSRWHNRELARKLSALKRELKGRFDAREAAIVTILQRVMDIIDPPALPVPPQKDIGFHVKESRRRYVASRRRNHALRS